MDTETRLTTAATQEPRPGDDNAGAEAGSACRRGLQEDELLLAIVVGSPAASGDEVAEAPGAAHVLGGQGNSREVHRCCERGRERELELELEAFVEMELSRS